MRNKQQGDTPTTTSPELDSTNRGLNFPSITLGEWLTSASGRLAASENDVERSTSLADVRLLAVKMLDVPKTQVMAHPEMQLNKDQLALLETGLKRLLNGEALPYVLGEWDFYGRTFSLTPDVLIPRPETELIIDHVLEWARSHRCLRFVDVGTGSGCIAVTLAMELPEAHGIAGDISHLALNTAKANIRRYEVQERLELLQADLLSALASSSVDLICANLPYIPSARLVKLTVAKREPVQALDGGPQGLDLIERLIPQAARILLPGGLALLEIDDTHTEAVLPLVRRYFSGRAQVIDDYQGKPRLLKLINQRDG